MDAIDLVNKKLISLDPLISAHFAFEDYLEAYRHIDENREQCMKVIIDVDPELD